MARNDLTVGDGVLSFEGLPFITGVKRVENAFPAPLPFRLEVDTETGCIAQPMTAAKQRQLADVYEEGSMLSTPVGEGVLNAPLAAEILSLLVRITGGVEAKRFLEPGCGTGYLLGQLKQQGAAICLGCEPGPQAAEGAARYCVDILQDFFTPQSVTGEYDCIYSYGVLEHVLAPADFLRNCLDRLAPGGHLLAIVPNCEPDFALGNISILAHEHVNYFTADSLQALFRRCGAVDVSAQCLQYSNGILAVHGRKGKGEAFESADWDAMVAAERKKLTRYGQQLDALLSSLGESLDDLARKGQTAGLYGVPTALAGLFPQAGFRCFDGDPTKHDGWFAGAPNAIEPPEHLIDNPVDVLFVVPIHHDAAIRRYLKTLLPETSPVQVASILEMARLAGTQSKI